MNKCLERVNDRHFWNPGVFSYAMMPRCRHNSSFFFIHCRIYSLWVLLSEDRFEKKNEVPNNVIMHP